MEREKAVHLNVVILQSSPRDVAITTERFSAYGCKVVGTGTSGAEAIDLVRRQRPNVIIMDPYLPTFNCDEITELLEQEFDYPLIKMVISEQKNEAIADRFFTNGGDIFQITPIDIPFCMGRIEQHIRMRLHQEKAEEPDLRIRNTIRKLLIQMQMPMTINGFFYTIDAVEMAVNQPTLLKRLVSDLYPAVGKKHETAPSNIERCIRTAVEQTFERGELNALYPTFAHVIRSKTGKPANGDFIAVLSHLVRAQLGMD